MSHPRTLSFTIGTLARQAGVAVDTVRYYERRGLLPPPQRRISGYREYTQADVQRIGFIRNAKALGFTLDEIRELMRLKTDRHHGVEGIKQRTQQRLDAINQHIARLLQVRDRLTELLKHCPGSGEPDHCPIVTTIDAKTIDTSPAAVVYDPDRNHQS